MPSVPLQPRILLYSHDSFGLGHLRRSLTLATELRRRSPEADIVLVTGSPCATHFRTPPGVEIVKVPSATKDAAGAYVSRRLGGGLGALVKLRSRLLLELTRSFRPDLLLVDHKVLGLAGELEPVLRRARSMGTRCVLGVRDIIDEPETVAREWGDPRVRAALSDAYDAVFVYGAPEVYDPRVEYPVPPELGERLRFTGYVVREASRARLRPMPSLRPRVLVTVGGGEDGAERVETLLDAVEAKRPEWSTTVVLGPLFDAARARHVKRRARGLSRVDVHLFYRDLPRLLAESSAVVSMAGYNSVAEILRSRVPAVLLPRCFPRKEQLVRARRLEALGLVECLPQLDARLLGEAVERALGRPALREAELPPLDGASKLAQDALGLVGVTAPAAQREVSR